VQDPGTTRLTQNARPLGRVPALPGLRFPLLVLAAAILFLGVIRLGDLPGYDDALYSLQAKGILQTGDWLTPRVGGEPALEHPPLFVWVQAVFFAAFGISDPAAKLPAALSALAIVLLVYWLARRLLTDKLPATVAMFVMLATPYAVKYAGHAMTDMPTTLLFLCAICAWSLADDNPCWYLAAGAFTGLALVTRSLTGLGLPAIFAVHMVANRRRPAWKYLVPALLIALLPPAAWWGYLLFRYGEHFLMTHVAFLHREVFETLTPAWRRYTGALEYAWTLTKSYWPWLPVMLAGLVTVIRERRRQLCLLLAWAGIVFLLCSITGSRVLRYMLPAYPVFAILSAIGLLRWVPRRIVERAMDWIPPLAVAAAICIVALLPPRWHAAETRAIAQKNSQVISSGERVYLYDKGDPRYDETNELGWYGRNVASILITSADLEKALQDHSLRVFVVDKATYKQRIKILPHDVIAEAGNLISVRLKRGV